MTGPDGLVLGETTTTVTTLGRNTSTSVMSVDVLTDVLGSAVATASEGVISADLHLFGDFGDELTSPKVDTVAGFTGKVSTAGVVVLLARLIRARGCGCRMTGLGARPRGRRL